MEDISKGGQKQASQNTGNFQIQTDKILKSNQSDIVVVADSSGDTWKNPRRQEYQEDGRSMRNTKFWKKS